MICEKKTVMTLGTKAKRCPGFCLPSVRDTVVAVRWVVNRGFSTMWVIGDCTFQSSSFETPVPRLSTGNKTIKGKKKKKKKKKKSFLTQVCRARTFLLPRRAASLPIPIGRGRQRLKRTLVARIHASAPRVVRLILAVL